MDNMALQRFATAALDPSMVEVIGIPLWDPWEILHRFGVDPMDVHYVVGYDDRNIPEYVSSSTGLAATLASVAYVCTTGCAVMCVQSSIISGTYAPCG
ncbi:unnamed protein product, partial [Mesorhabditis spiculigera]